jgi:hypothetical protein
MRSVKTLLAVGALAVTTLSCGDVVRQGRSPMFLVIDSMQGRRGGGDGEFGVPLLSDVLTLITSPDPCTPEVPCPTIFNDLGEVTLRIVPKDIGLSGSSTEPSSNNAVTITRYRVVYRRADGRNDPGVDVPFAFDGAVTATIAPGAAVVVPIELVRHAAKTESPLVQLVNSSQIVTTIAEVTLYGSDLVGNDVSATGNIQIDFGNFGDF